MYTHAHTVYLVCLSITDIFPAGALSNLSQIMMLLVRNIFYEILIALRGLSLQVKLCHQSQIFGEQER